MSRVKRGPHRRYKRKRTLKLAKGYYGKKKNAYRIARQAVERALRFSYRDRRQKKREFRKLWIVRINAASRENGLSYNRLISGLRQSGLELNRKVLADIAVHDAEGFAAIVEVAKEALEEAGEAGVKVRPATEKGKRPPKRDKQPETKEAAPAKEKPKPKPKPKKEKEPEAEEKPAAKKAAPEKKKEAKPEPKAEAKQEKPKKAPEVEGPTTKKELEALTVPELEELAEKRGIDKGDVEGSGASGNVIKADWVRVLSK